jgi:hypothetical protein
LVTHLVPDLVAVAAALVLLVKMVRTELAVLVALA